MSIKFGKWCDNPKTSARPPCDAKAVVEVEFANGARNANEPAGSWDWSDADCPFTIERYRLIERTANEKPVVRGANHECPVCMGDGGYYVSELPQHRVYFDGKPVCSEPAFVKTTTHGAHLLQKALQEYLPEANEADLRNLLLAAFESPR